MKRCPECRRDYHVDSLLYCLDDGTALVEGPGSGELTTLILPDARSSGGPYNPLPRTANEDESLAERTKSVAVLPFVNVSADPENDYFCDGLSEEILNALAKVQGLKVAARTSAFSFKGKNIDVSQIGKALHVESVLEGSVRRSGNRLRITAQLINASDGYQ